MKSFTLTILLCLVLKGVSQPLLGQYSFYPIQSNIGCYLYLLDKGQYYIDVSETTDDIVESCVLSYGNYFVYNDSITLIDELHGFTSVLQKDGDSIRVKRSFAFLIGNSFVFDYYSKELPIRGDTDTIRLQSERSLYNNQNKDKHRLLLGKHKSDWGYELLLQDKNEFWLKYRDCLILNGKWNRNGNILQLHDSTIGCSFYMLIGEYKLISKLLPGDYSGELFKKVEENSSTKQIQKTGFGCSRRKQ